MDQSLHFRVIADLSSAETAWKTLSPNKTIDDNWQFRFTFYKYLQYDLHFIAGYRGEELIGLLPLQKNDLTGLQPPYALSEPFLEFFGGDDTDDNDILLKPGYEQHKKDFLAQVNQPAVLAPLASTFASQEGAALYENKYALPLEGFSSYEDYLSALWGKSSRKKIRQQIRGLYKSHKITVHENQYEDLAILFALNIKRFGEKSSFSLPYRQDIFRDLIHQFQVEMLTIELDGKKEAVSYGIVYNNAYIGMNAGVNNDIDDLGKLLVLLQIERAIKCGCSVYDGGKGSGSWKEEFKFTPIPQYKLVLP